MLRLMGRDADQPLTPDVAKEMCQRANRHVMINGSIANLGREYLLTLEATDCVSGKNLAESKAEAATKEKVLSALDSTADKLRHNLGESAKSVERFEVPIAQATTSSLEALKAYSVGEYMVGRSGSEEIESLPVFRRAVELDPNFAMAYAAIATDYFNLNEFRLAEPYYKKAFDLSGRVSERRGSTSGPIIMPTVREIWHKASMSISYGPRPIRSIGALGSTSPMRTRRPASMLLQLPQASTLYASIPAGRSAIACSLALTCVPIAMPMLKSTVLRAQGMGKDSYNLETILFQLAFIDDDQAADGA